MTKLKKRKQATDTMKKDTGRGSVYQLATRSRRKKLLESYSGQYHGGFMFLHLRLGPKNLPHNTFSESGYC